MTDSRNISMLFNESAAASLKTLRKMCKRASEIYLKEELCVYLINIFKWKQMKKNKNENYPGTLTKRVKTSVQDRPEISGGGMQNTCHPCIISFEKSRIYF